MRAPSDAKIFRLVFNVFRYEAEMFNEKCWTRGLYPALNVIPDIIGIMYNVTTRGSRLNTMSPILKLVLFV